MWFSNFLNKIHRILGHSFIYTQERSLWYLLSFFWKIYLKRSAYSKPICPIQIFPQLISVTTSAGYLYLARIVKCQSNVVCSFISYGTSSNHQMALLVVFVTTVMAACQWRIRCETCDYVVIMLWTCDQYLEKALKLPSDTLQSSLIKSMEKYTIIVLSLSENLNAKLFYLNLEAKTKFTHVYYKFDQ
jgi:hypothetical protein